MAIKVYNTKTRSKEDLVPREEKKISMYVCGPTVYNYVHIGNARTFLNFDMIRRYLEFAGYSVTFVQNITDVDDKIINRAVEEGTTAGAVSEEFRDAFEEDMAALGVRPPDIAPRATEHVGDMIEVIKALVEKGNAYVSAGDVYFDVSSFEDYGKLSGRDLSEQKVTVQFNAEMERKDDPWDFALWKAAREGEPCWDSPWGPGRPGWHIECSTMATKYLGAGFDIHGGGLDLVFPHHENETAQAEAFGEQFVRYWIHSGMLNIDQEKMSKSLGNIKTLREVLDEYDPDTIRMLMLGTHYRSPLSFSDESLEEARASIERIKNCIFNMEDLPKRLGEPEELELSIGREMQVERYLDQADSKFREAMDDDFNSASALAVIFGVVREINSYINEVSESGFNSPGVVPILQEASWFLDTLCKALGLFQFEEAAEPSTPASEGPEKTWLIKLARDTGVGEAGIAEKSSDQLIELLLEARLAAREMEDFKQADAIRNGLTDIGVRVEDVKGGYRWRFER
jgi:cysteinyl-tRNA synthetase